MNSGSQTVVGVLNALLDAVLILLAYVSAVLAFFALAYPEYLEKYYTYYLTNRYVVIMMTTYALLMVFVYYARGVYKLTTPRRFRRDLRTFAVTNFAGILGVVIILFAFKNVHFSRPMLMCFYALSLLYLGVRHFISRAIYFRLTENGRWSKHVVIVGDGRLARNFARSIAQDSNLGYMVEGYFSADGTVRGLVSEEDALQGETSDTALTEGVDADGADEEASDTAEGDIAALGPLLGSYHDIEQVLEERSFDEIVIALEPEETHQLKYVLAAGDKQGVRLSIISIYNECLPSTFEVESVGNDKLINVRAIPLDNLGWAVLKRLFDIVISAFILVFFCWLYAIVALGVKLSSPGPVMFVQERIGKNKKIFKMYKFRSMRVNAEEGTAWTTDQDPRKTKFGSFIRKYSLDELPQFWNVLKGDMSIVGPRPEIPYHVGRFKEAIPLYMVRHQVRPGITGWAQINGFRGDTSVYGRIKLDVWYIENWTFGLDVKIFFKTIFGGFANEEKLK